MFVSLARFHVNQLFLVLCCLKSAYTGKETSNQSDVLAVTLFDWFSKNTEKEKNNNM